MERLSKTQWLDHGLETLAQKGFTALKADTLAKSLGVSRGSFYWHFKNLNDYQTAVLKHWQDLSSTQVITMLEQEPITAKEKLEKLITLAIGSERKLEQAIRSWAINNKTVAQTVNQIDHTNLNYVQTLIERIVPQNKQAHTKARVIYASYLGQLILADELSQKQQIDLVNELMQLLSN